MQKEWKKPHGAAFWKTTGQAAGLWVVAALAAALLLPGGAMELPADPSQRLQMALLVCVGKPVLEELIYRGVVQRLLRLLGGPEIALAGQAVLFALGHEGISAQLYALVMGVVLGWSAEQTGRVWPGMLLHSINNWVVFAGCLAGGNIG